MNDSYLPLLTFLLGCASGFIGGVASGGGLLSIPGLMFLGLPPSAAIATNNLCVASSLTSAWRYHKHTSINIRLVKSLIWASFLGGLLGASLLLLIDVSLMRRLFGLICLFLAFLITADKRVKNIKANHKLLAPTSVLLADVFAGMFGTGGGILLIYALSYSYGLPLREANANSKLIALGGITSILAVFAHAGVINLTAGIPLMIGSAIGGYFGAHTALKKEEKLIKKLLSAVAVAAGLKLLI